MYSAQQSEEDDDCGGFEIKYLTYSCRSGGRNTSWKDEGVSLTLDTSSVRNAASNNDCEHCSKARHRMPVTRLVDRPMNLLTVEQKTLV